MNRKKGEETMDIKLPTLVACAVSWMALSSPAHAIDFNGAWATGASVCNKVFIKKGGAISFRPGSSQFGGGFVIEGNKIRGQQQNCTIKARKEEGNVVHMLAGCADDIMTSSIQFSARIIDDNTISRIFPGMSDDLSIKYSRCPM
jgi:hypothetical protein